ncbi:probable serine/threonine-protein kinase PBL11 [Macadamia integrifolia]|uniref:probable serine/threonine-protein kinase PBL11 n=1 Tax=Macadamia integrifolia TaxID=60698 RepID=UPI001C4F1F91|nr:probable serine/threonine-protein kinase PBL11 [Macadamia integrifolia]
MPKMGCFPVLKGRKKKSEKSIYIKRVNPQENTPTTLPEPQTHSRALQSAPPSFKTRPTTVQPANVQPANRVTNSRARALSAPSSLNVEEGDALSPFEYDEQEELKNRGGLPKEQRAPSPQPLPLPSPRSTGSGLLKTMGSFKSGNISGPLALSGPLPLPPLVLRNFSYEEVASACQYFSPVQCMSEGLSSIIYRASFGEDSSGAKKLEATVVRLPSTQGFKEFVHEVNTLASLQHPQLCKLIGFHAREGSEQRMLVYERLFKGSLDRLLYGRSDGPLIDWNARMKVALCAAQGLAFLHEEGPFQAMYNEFSTANIQVDKDFSAKLSGYGCVSHSAGVEISDTSPALASMSVETLEGGLLTPKSNVWSYGIVLLELLTGRKNLDSRHPKGEKNIVKWSRPFLADDCRLSLIMDPQLKGRFPTKAARTVADIALKCLQKDPSERPTMRTIVEALKDIQDMKVPCLFPLQEPEAITRKLMARSPSLNGIVTHHPRLSFSPSPPSGTRPSVSTSGRHSMPLSLPPPTCSSIISVDEIITNEGRKSASSAVRRAGVEGF